jgi:hypothetical protein
MSEVDQTERIPGTSPVYAPYNGTSAVTTAAVPPRRLRGLRMPVVPSLSFLAQVGGGGAMAWGVFDRWGLNVLAILGGATAVVLGALRESGRI